jgi:uncharacterized glyoxalase superfamily protein PhnB
VSQPDLVGIVVADMSAALAFYRMLGMDIPAAMDEESHVEVTLAGGFRIAWDSVELMGDIHGAWPRAAGHRMVLAFKCDTPAEVDSLYGRLTGAGYAGHKPPWDAFWGQRYAVVEDPDGNLVDIFAAQDPQHAS